jgi:type IV pilus assembly protein PilX
MAKPANNFHAMMARCVPAGDRALAQRGYVMILSIILLLVITALSVSMAKSFFLEEGMAGNIREKNRSLAAAQAALSYAESVVSQGGTINTACGSGDLTPSGTNTPPICTGAASIISSSSVSPLGTYFKMPTSLTSTYLAVNQTIAKDTFWAQPGAYIQYIGVVPGTGVYVYSITAYGYGATPNSVSIVSSTYEVVAVTEQVNNAQGY